MTLKHWTGHSTLGAIIALLAAGCALAQSANAQSVLHVASKSFTDGQPMPQNLSCDGPDVSPDLQWSAAPAATQSYAIVVTDTDAAGFTHWLAYDIPASTRDIPEGASTPSKRLDQAAEGDNSFGHAGYGGPCPPEGNPHHYVFQVYALDVNPRLTAGQSTAQVMAAMKGHVLAQGQITGLYTRGGGS
jgi:Raf kinase inhibitor-like YbhB/YbcL family protein